VIAARTGPAQGTNSGPSPTPRTKPLVERPERRHDQPESDEPEDGESRVAQQVLWQVEGAEQRRSGEGERGETEDQTGDDGDRSSAASVPGVRRRRGCSGDEDDRKDRQDAR
jgi:hypothetical protein